ncbi:MAG: hypothetical protein HZC28_05975 [Spirochaetes bacterium]|nr:hypothetical protein [Spirochaetota bacterium]
MKTTYNTLVIGATLAGLGIAYRDREETLVVESTAMVGPEFLYAYRYGTGWDTPPQSDEGKRLKQELLDRNILKDGAAHIPGLMPVLYARIGTDHLPVSFMTEVLDVTSSADGFAVTLFNASGKTPVTVKRIIDTTSACRSAPGKGITFTGKHVSALLGCPPCDGSIPAANGVSVSEGRFGHERIFSVTVPVDAAWPAARETFFRAWAARDARLGMATLAAVGMTFDVSVPKGPKTISDGWVHLPSAAYDNALAAFDAGCVFGA